MEGELVLDEEAVVDAAEAMEINWLWYRERKMEAWRKAQILTERERERWKTQRYKMNIIF